jgi:hypothetical protein
MGELKSAWEIAQERARKLGDLSPEERKQQKEKECLEIARALADKYLVQPDARLLANEVAKRHGLEKELITKFLIHRFVEAIDLRSPATTQRAIDGILSLNQNATVKDTMERIKEVLQEYQAAEARQKEEIEKAGREILHQMRVSGTAIGRINIRARQEWQKKLEKIASPFEEALRTLKQKLLDGT